MCDFDVEIGSIYWCVILKFNIFLIQSNNKNISTRWYRWTFGHYLFDIFRTKTTINNNKIEKKTYYLCKTNTFIALLLESNNTINCICMLCVDKNPKIYRLHIKDNISKSWKFTVWSRRTIGNKKKLK